MLVLGALCSFLEPFCGYSSPKIDKVSWKLTFEIPPQRASGGEAPVKTPITPQSGDLNSQTQTLHPDPEPGSLHPNLTTLHPAPNLKTNETFTRPNTDQLLRVKRRARALQGCLAQGAAPPPRTLQYAYHYALRVLGVGAAPCERGTFARRPRPPSPDHHGLALPHPIGWLLSS